MENKITEDGRLVIVDDIENRISIPKDSKIKIVEIKECTIKTGVVFESLENLDAVMLSKCQFTSNASLILNKCHCKNFSILYCCSSQGAEDLYRNVITLEECKIGELWYKNSFFNNCIELSKTEISRTFCLEGGSFRTLNASHCEFKDEIHMSRIEGDNVYMHFDGMSLRNLFTLDDCRLTKLRFTGGSILQNGHLLLRGSFIHAFVLKNLSISGLISFAEEVKFKNTPGVLGPTTTWSKCKSLNISSCFINGQLDIDINLVEDKSKIDSITANYLKREAIKKHDFINARKLHKIEMDATLKSLTPKTHKVVSGLSRVYHNLCPRTKVNQSLILLLNRISNNHGTSWIRAVGFIMIWALFFTICIEWALMCNDKVFFEWSPAGRINFCHAALDVVNIFRFSYIVDGVELSVWGKVWYLLSRVFIAYGVYQLISAFRTFGKSTS